MVLVKTYKSLILFTLVLICSINFVKVFAASPACGVAIDPVSIQNASGSKSYPDPTAMTGVDWVRIEFKSCTKDNTGDAFFQSLEDYATIIDGYRNIGVNVLLIIDYMSYPDAANNVGAFAERAGFIAQRLGSGGMAYEIWNEPDLVHVGNLSAIEYAELLRATAGAIKSSSGATVITAGLASGDVGYLSLVKETMGSDWGDLIDGVGVHPYGKAPNTCKQYASTGDIESFVDNFYNTGGKPLWITEFGIDTSDNNAAKVYLECVYDYAQRQRSKLAVVIWFAWSDSMVAPFGLITSGGSKKAAYDSFFEKACGVSPTSPSFLTPVIWQADPGEGCAPPSGIGIGQQTEPRTIVGRVMMAGIDKEEYTVTAQGVTKLADIDPVGVEPATSMTKTVEKTNKPVTGATICAYQGTSWDTDMALGDKVRFLAKGSLDPTLKGWAYSDEDGYFSFKTELIRTPIDDGIYRIASYKFPEDDEGWLQFVAVFCGELRDLYVVPINAQMGAGEQKVFSFGKDACDSQRNSGVDDDTCDKNTTIYGDPMYVACDRVVTKSVQCPENFYYADRENILSCNPLSTIFGLKFLHQDEGKILSAPTATITDATYVGQDPQAVPKSDLASPESMEGRAGNNMPEVSSFSKLVSLYVFLIGSPFKWFDHTFYEPTDVSNFDCERLKACSGIISVELDGENINSQKCWGPTLSLNSSPRDSAVFFYNILKSLASPKASEGDYFGNVCTLNGEVKTFKDFQPSQFMANELKKLPGVVCDPSSSTYGDCLKNKLDIPCLDGGEGCLGPEYFPYNSLFALEFLGGEGNIFLRVAREAFGIKGDSYSVTDNPGGDNRRQTAYAENSSATTDMCDSDGKPCDSGPDCTVRCGAQVQNRTIFAWQAGRSNIANISAVVTTFNPRSVLAYMHEKRGESCTEETCGAFAAADMFKMPFANEAGTLAVANGLDTLQASSNVLGINNFSSSCGHYWHVGIPKATCAYNVNDGHMLNAINKWLVSLGDAISGMFDKEPDIPAWMPQVCRNTYHGVGYGGLVQLGCNALKTFSMIIDFHGGCDRQPDGSCIKDPGASNQNCWDFSSSGCRDHPDPGSGIDCKEYPWLCCKCDFRCIKEGTGNWFTGESCHYGDDNCKCKCGEPIQNCPGTLGVQVPLQTGLKEIAGRGLGSMLPNTNLLTVFLSPTFENTASTSGLGTINRSSCRAQLHTLSFSDPVLDVEHTGEAYNTQIGVAVYKVMKSKGATEYYDDFSDLMNANTRSAVGIPSFDNDDVAGISTQLIPGVVPDRPAPRLRTTFLDLKICDEYKDTPVSCSHNVKDIDTLIKDLAVSGQTADNIKRCYNYIVSKSCESTNMDPSFALANWIKFSEASTISTWDFGCSAFSKNNISDQFEGCFLQMGDILANSLQYAKCRNIAPIGVTSDKFMQVLDSGDSGCLTEGKYLNDTEYIETIKSLYKKINRDNRVLGSGSIVGKSDWSR